PGFSAKADTPEQGLANFLADIKRRNWDHAFANVVKSNTASEQVFQAEWLGINGGLRAFSSLESYDGRPLHATDSEAGRRARLHWSTPVGPVEDVRDFRLKNDNGPWRVVWEEPQAQNVPAQVIPVNYLRWDLVSGTAGEEWGSRNVDAPH